jgi:hypothetical protein
VSRRFAPFSSPYCSTSAAVIAAPNESPRRTCMLTAFGSARSYGLPLELCGPASRLSFLLRASSDDTYARSGVASGPLAAGSAMMQPHFSLRNDSHPRLVNAYSKPAWVRSPRPGRRSLRKGPVDCSEKRTEWMCLAFRRQPWPDPGRRSQPENSWERQKLPIPLIHTHLDLWGQIAVISVISGALEKRAIQLERIVVRVHESKVTSVQEGIFAARHPRIRLLS